MNHSILFTDIKHCTADFAEEIINDYQKDVDIFLQENEDINDDFYYTKQDCEEVTLAEFIWHAYWPELVDFLRQRYEWQV